MAANQNHVEVVCGSRGGCKASWPSLKFRGVPAKKTFSNSLATPMDFDDFLRIIEKNFQVQKTKKGTYLVIRDGRVAEVERHNNCCYDNFFKFFETIPRDNDVGHDDLHPRIQIGDRVSGSRVDREHPLFGRRPLYQGENLRHPRFAKFDPMGPTKDKSRGFGPDPDHLRKPGPDGGLF